VESQQLELLGEVFVVVLEHECAQFPFELDVDAGVGELVAFVEGVEVATRLVEAFMVLIEDESGAGEGHGTALVVEGHGFLLLAGLAVDHFDESPVVLAALVFDAVDRVGHAGDDLFGHGGVELDHLVAVGQVDGGLALAGHALAHPVCAVVDLVPDHVALRLRNQLLHLLLLYGRRDGVPVGLLRTHVDVLTGAQVPHVDFAFLGTLVEVLPDFVEFVLLLDRNLLQQPVGEFGACPAAVGPEVAVHGDHVDNLQRLLGGLRAPTVVPREVQFDVVVAHHLLLEQ